MKNNLYYTPTIEEFHVGFEYEHLTGFEKEFKPYIYDLAKACLVIERESISHNGEIVKMFIPAIQACIEENQCRVKYLDQSDIESLGWMLSHQYNGAWWEIGKLIPDPEEMWHPLGNWKYRLSLGENNRVHIDGRNPGNGGQTSRFNGTIKNKSQLKFIMTCLGILE